MTKMCKDEIQPYKYFTVLVTASLAPADCFFFCSEQWLSLFQTFIFTDGEDKDLRQKAGSVFEQLCLCNNHTFYSLILKGYFTMNVYIKWVIYVGEM